MRTRSLAWLCISIGALGITGCGDDTTTPGLTGGGGSGGEGTASSHSSSSSTSTTSSTGGQGGDGGMGGAGGSAPVACDVATNQCPDGQKCSIRYGDDGAYHTLCSDSGDVGADGMCTRPTGVSGVDTCDAGFYCSSDGLDFSNPQARQCLPFCTADIDCATGTSCVVLVADGTGLCAKTCDITVQDCGTLQTCTQSFGADGLDHGAVCAVAGGSAALGEACPTYSECAPGLGCYPIGDVEGPTCTNFCRKDADCASGSVCIAEGDDVSGAYGVCGTQCDLEDASACPSDKQCTYYGKVDGTAAATCGLIGGLAEGAPCLASTDWCGPGLACGYTATGGACSKQCSSTSPCDAGTFCAASGQDAGTGKIYGICLTPCDPIAQDCSGTDACVESVDALGSQQAVCVPSMGKMPGDACTSIYQCEAGTYCSAPPTLASSGFDAICSPYCEVASPTCATGGCVPLNDTVGFCYTSDFTCSSGSPTATTGPTTEVKLQVGASHHVKLCNAADAACATPVAQVDADAQGVATLTVAQRFDGYFDVTGGTDLEALVYVAPSALTTARYALTPRIESATALAARVNEVVVPLTAIVTAYASDCAPYPAINVAFATSSSDGTTHVGYVDAAGKESATATSTLPGSSAEGVLLNVPGATTTLSFAAGATTEASRAVTLRTGVETQVYLSPIP